MDETHMACPARLEADGALAECCYCSPHSGCELLSETVL